ncbi:MAG TPA: tetratricopeptide repeat protein [Alphaproteobacteria bacterium]|nr:tetratricopeptide repeat protein [Alphaproteobacteria bacterium]
MTRFCRTMSLCVLTLAASACADMTVAKRAAERGDQATARAHLEKLADFGLPEAQRQLGSLLLADEAGGADAARGVRLLESAGAQGETKAFLDLGKAYEKGTGVAPNQAKALDYYMKAAQSGDPRAALQLGGFYEEQKNAGQAVRWYQKALDDGNPKAAFRLGRLYQRGKVVAPDTVKALAYYYVAQRAGVPEAIEPIRALEMNQEPGKIAESKTLAQRLTR